MIKVIDISSCELVIEAPQITISDKTKFLDLKKLKGFSSCYDNKFDKNFKHCDIDKALIDGCECDIEITFEHEFITLLKFSIYNQGGWEGWSEKNQIKVKECNSEWLLKVTGKRPPYKSKNGIIDSVYDMKSADSYIYFSYPQNRGKS